MWVGGGEVASCLCKIVRSKIPEVVSFLCFFKITDCCFV